MDGAEVEEEQYYSLIGERAVGEEGRVILSPSAPLSFHQLKVFLSRNLNCSITFNHPPKTFLPCILTHLFLALAMVLSDVRIFSFSICLVPTEGAPLLLPLPLALDARLRFYQLQQ